MAAERLRKRNNGPHRHDLANCVVPLVRSSLRTLPVSMSAVLAVGMLVSDGASSADWTITPTLNIRETYTDNVRLAPRGQEQSEWVTEIDPGISVHARGARLQLQANYAYQQRLYKNNSDANGHNHALNSSGLLDVWNRNLFIQASANIAQQNVSPLGVQSDSNINLTGNRYETRQVNVSPYWVSRLGSWANLQARYTWNQAESTGTTSALDSESQGINLSISSGPAFSTIGWSTAYSRQEIESSNNQFTQRELESTSASLQYRLFPTLSLTGTVGREDNSYGSVRGSSSGSFWNAGVDWRPSSRTQARATLGEAIFGKTYSLDASHRTRLTTWTVGYSESIVATPGTFSVPSSVSTAAILDGLFINQFPNPVEREQVVAAFIALTGLPTSLITSVDFLTNQVSLSKRLHGGFGLRGVRSSLLLNVFRDDRTNQSIGTQTSILGTDPFSLSDRVVQTGYSAIFSWRFSAHTSGSVSGSQTRSKLSDTGQEQTNNSFGIGISHQIQRRIRGAVNYRITEHESGIAGTTSLENTIVGTLSFAF